LDVVRHWFGRKKTARRRRFVVVSAFLLGSFFAQRLGA